jgi:hypothetical protein
MSEKVVSLDKNNVYMAETVEDDPSDNLEKLSDEEFEERFERDTKSFVEKLKEYSPE